MNDVVGLLLFVLVWLLVFWVIEANSKMNKENEAELWRIRHGHEDT